MTIKRRIFVSNILMIVVPVLLLALFAFLMWLISIGRIGLYGGRDLSHRQILSAVKGIERKFSQWDGDAASLQSEIDVLNAELNKIHVAVSIIPNGAASHSEAIDNAVAQLIGAADEEGAPESVQISISMHDMNGFTLVIASDESDGGDEEPDGLFKPGITLLVAVIAIIMVTNAVLTGIMYRHIIEPLNTLVDGVHEIRDGNLLFRIAYTTQDEFAPICNDFNVMAERLYEMVRTRQKDEESRKELIAGISHDLRTPLTAIKAYVEGIEKGVASTPALKKKYIDTIKGKTEDLAHIIDQLFLFSKLDLEEFPLLIEPIRLDEMIGNLLDEIGEEYAKKGLVIAWSGTSEAVTIRADRQWLRNVVVNVAENSVQYKNKAMGHMRVSLRADDDVAVLRMEDDGPGVPPQTLRSLFDVFYRSDPARNAKGSGLGLAIAAKVMRKMGGRIWAENAGAAGGLAVVLSFPAV